MLETILEFRKGILFVRITGELSINTAKKLNTDVISVVTNNGIRNVVLNARQLTYIDQKGMNLLLYLYEICKSRDGHFYICNLADGQVYMKLKKNRILNYLEEMKDELSILHKVSELEVLA